MTDSISWDFIASCEGGMRLDGYVPEDASGASGVTLAAGVDLGRLGAEECRQLSPELSARLVPYCGQTGVAARKILQNNPLRISPLQARALMNVKASGFLAAIHRHYDRLSPVPFDRLPCGPATVLMSLCWQYGDPWTDKHCGQAWQLACLGAWRKFAAYLGRNFPDRRYQTRRKREADFLLAHLYGANDGVIA